MADDRSFPDGRGPDPVHHLLGVAEQQDDHRLLRGRTQLLRLPERSGDRRRLHVGRLLPRHLRLHRPVRLRRLPLLHRLPGRLAGGAAAGRRAAPELRPLHDGRPARVPDATGAGSQRRRHLDDRGVDLLPAGADGRGRQPGRSAARGELAADQEPGDRRSRHPHDHLRHPGRHEGHHLGADRQGRAADGRHLVDHDPGAVRVPLQPLRAARCRRREDGQGRGVPAARAAVRQGPGGQVRLPVAGSGPGARHRRTAAHPDPLLHHTNRERSAQVGAVGDRSDRCLLPDDPGARLRRRRPGRHRPRQPDRQVVGQPGLTAAGPSGRRRARQSRRVGPAGADLGRRLRHHPGRRRRV